MKQKFFLFSFFVFSFLISHSATFHTIANGYFNQPSVWQNGNIPPLSSSDSIMIHHDIALTDDLELINGGHLEIDSSGGICGHITLTMGVNSTMLKYGYCQIDTLLIPGGDVDFYPPGFSIFAMWAQLSNGGSFSLNGSGLVVGAWFQCQKGPTGVNEIIFDEIIIYPNPVIDEIILPFRNDEMEQIRIYDLTGKMVLETSFTNRIPTRFLEPGIYILKFFRDKTEFQIKFVKE